MPHSSYKFTHALCRQPGKSVAHGLRAVNGGDPVAQAFLDEHSAYVAALRATGATVVVEPAQEDFPDSVFVEDPALCIMGKAIILRPGAPSRFGERDGARAALARILGPDNIIDLPEGGLVDGGDILVSGHEVLVGLSARTNQAGVDLLRGIVEPLGLALRVVNTPAHILHFKTGCAILDDTTIFAVQDLAGCFPGYRTITCPAGEEPAANLIRFNDKVFCAKGFPKTRALLETEGYNVATLSVTEAAKVDGGLSCMSLRFSV
ncbi:dimethylarginine dimethylaminohydrolase family protein [Abyssibius alkaniclasticus]|uniref:dimethylarginine dimethylaminohydrolase family protein n=1 Tax=Abyssibius alkaniclasticus TaxID=2881234 RepID=UPI004058CE62